MTTIATLPTPPSRSDPASFATRADDFLAALPAFGDECNTVAAEVNANATAAEAAALRAEEAGAAKWISGTTYAEGVIVWSPANYQTYRRKSAGGGTTDPSGDQTNWAHLDAELAWTTLTLASLAFPLLSVGGRYRITGGSSGAAADYGVNLPTGISEGDITIAWVAGTLPIYVRLGSGSETIEGETDHWIMDIPGECRVFTRTGATTWGVI